MVDKCFPDILFSLLKFAYSLDNAAMIGAAACFRFTYMTDTEKEKALAN